LIKLSGSLEKLKHLNMALEAVLLLKFKPENLNTYVNLNDRSIGKKLQFIVISKDIATLIQDSLIIL
jgi:hypothetical protein